VSSSIGQISELARASTQMSDFRSFIDYPDTANRGDGLALPPLDAAPEIRLADVSYTYPGSGSPVLEDINVTIRAGERIAIVGANGAGKTTLVSLICGLLHPTTGRLTVSGLNISEFNRDEYFRMISAVFQDIHLLIGSIANNVSQQPDHKTDRDRVEDCLTKAGLRGKVDSLPGGAGTLLDSEVNEDALDLSGGERQKLALARALYKDAPIIILDEPTAALDPIAENEMYQQYAELTGTKTSMYISHRLASTRFCDRILFIDGGRITEEGSHEFLMEQDGKYAEMFAVQAGYYQEDFARL
jgi:ABC-type multidrug transport system fused ATPase/permease subunit